MSDTAIPPDDDSSEEPAGAPQAIDLLLERAFEAISRGDRAAANDLAEQVLALDQSNADAEDLLTAPVDRGEIRRLTIMFVDLVDSTALSTQVEPEVYRTVVGQYRRDVRATVQRYGGHLASTKGDGLLVLFGHPQAHEDDVRRAIQAGTDITREVEALSKKVRRSFGFDIAVRVGIHHGTVYLDIAEDDVYGLGANLAARMCSLADPGTVAVSETVERLVRGAYDMQAQQPMEVKGIEGPVRSYLILAERDVDEVRMGELVGRDRESQFLRDNWQRAVAGELMCPGVLLRGEAGLGKSRLAWSVVEFAERSGAVVLPLAGSPFHADVGLRPVRRLLERRCGIDRTSDPAESLQRLEREVTARLPGRTDLIPLLAPVLGITTGYLPASAEGLKLFAQIIGAIHEYLMACIDHTPTLVFADDIHWFDEDTIELLETLLRADTGGHTMVLMTGRTEAVVPLPDRVTILDLKPLTDDEADRLIMSIHPSATAEERRAVRRRSDGVPLFIEEITTKVKELPTDESRSVGVPDTLYEALFARLRSSPATVRVAEAAALAGSRFDRALLHAVVDLDTDEIDRAIAQLISGRVLRTLDNDSWSFRHELLREVAAELSPPTVRRALHARFADALVSSATDRNPDWPLLARHYANAERFAEAAAAYAGAAANARQRGALIESRTYLTHAIAQVEDATPGRDRDKQETMLRLSRGQLAYAAEGASSVNAANDYERCLKLSGSDVHGDELFATLTAMYGYYAMRADFARVETVLQSIRLNMTGRDWFKPFNDAGFGMLAWYRGQFGAAAERLENAAEAVTDEGVAAFERLWFMPNEGKASIYTHVALARYTQGDLAGAEAELARTAQRCADLAFPQGPFSLAYALQLEVLIRIDVGELARAAGAADQIVAIGEQHGFDSWTLAGAAQRRFVTAISDLANPDPAVLRQNIAVLQGTVDLWRALGVICLLPSYEAMIARLHICAGELTAARERIDAALQLAHDTGMHYHDAELLRLRAQTHDDPELRHANLLEALALAREQRGLIYELRCAIDDFILIGEQSRPALAAAVAKFPVESSWPDLTRAHALLQ
jgi:class 3 adenylate cyclase